MKNKVLAWALPISVSLLLHSILFLVFSDQRNDSNAVTQTEVFTVEMQAALQLKPVAKPRKQNLAKEKEPVKQQTISTETSKYVSVEEKQPPPAATSEASSASATNSTSTVVQPLNKLTRPPSFLNKIEPVYPASEQRSGSQAYILAEITLDAEGKLLDIKIVKSAGSYFDNAVIDAIRQSTFTPGYIEKQPVAVKVLVPFRFKLK